GPSVTDLLRAAARADARVPQARDRGGQALIAMGDDDQLRDLLDHYAISRLQASYGDVVTRRAWQELDSLFLPECPVRLDLRNGRTIEHVGPEAIGSFIAAAIERFEFFEFAVLNAVVNAVEGETASGRVYIWELR